MKVVILAGGLGTRLSEETSLRPKPMVEIGGKPMLWHIMKIYSTFGFHEFVICLGFKGYMIKEYFSNYVLHMSDVTIDMTDNSMEIHQQYAEPWKVTLVDTGAETLTGGRLRRVAPYLGNDTFMMTYGDGVADVDIQKLLAHHQNNGALATITSVQPRGRFGSLELDEHDAVQMFREKPIGDGSWINGGFMVLEPGVIDYISGDSISFETEPLERLARDGQLRAYRHRGFWQPMDTLRDKNYLEELWNSGTPPWRLW